MKVSSIMKFPVEFQTFRNKVQTLRDSILRYRIKELIVIHFTSSNLLFTTLISILS